uniref:Uncharacterized protein n=1 Tax=Auxenochlorella protothecoides TaxID=3075 RepID=A0A1D1ZYY0_AUXPR
MKTQGQAWACPLPSLHAGDMIARARSPLITKSRQGRGPPCRPHPCMFAVLERTSSLHGTPPGPLVAHRWHQPRALPPLPAAHSSQVGGPRRRLGRGHRGGLPHAVLPRRRADRRGDGRSSPGPQVCLLGRPPRPLRSPLPGRHPPDPPVAFRGAAAAAARRHAARPGPWRPGPRRPGPSCAAGPPAGAGGAAQHAPRRGRRPALRQLLRGVAAAPRRGGGGRAPRQARRRANHAPRQGRRRRGGRGRLPPGGGGRRHAAGPGAAPRLRRRAGAAGLPRPGRRPCRGGGVRGRRRHGRRGRRGRAAAGLRRLRRRARAAPAGAGPEPGRGAALRRVRARRGARSARGRGLAGAAVQPLVARHAVHAVLPGGAGVGHVGERALRGPV